MHPGGMRSAMDLFDFEKSANLKHPSVHRYLHIMCAFSFGDRGPSKLPTLGERKSPKKMKVF